jgi:hypothetical protein
LLKCCSWILWMTLFNVPSLKTAWCWNFLQFLKKQVMFMGFCNLNLRRRLTKTGFLLILKKMGWLSLIWLRNLILHRWSPTVNEVITKRNTLKGLIVLNLLISLVGLLRNLRNLLFCPKSWSLNLGLFSSTTSQSQVLLIATLRNVILSYCQLIVS